jgi:hypothetical protein
MCKHQTRTVASASAPCAFSSEHINEEKSELSTRAAVLSCENASTTMQHRTEIYIHNTSIAQEHFKLASTAQPLSAETKDPDECINGCQLISLSLLAVFSIRSPKCLSIKFKCALIKKCSEFLVLARGENNALFLVCREIAAWS